MRALPSYVIVAALLLGAAPLIADDVHLLDGRVLEGEVVSAPDEDPVRLRRGSGTLTVVQHIPRDQVVQVVFGTNERQLAVAAVQADRAALAAVPDGGDAEEWWALAERARDLGDPGLARELAIEVVARDRGHADARRLMGMTLVKGVWMRANEASVATGQVLHQGRWMTWDERQAAIADQERRVGLAAARREAADERRAARAAARAATQLPYGPISTPAYSYGGYGYGLDNPYRRHPTIVTWPGCGVGSGTGSSYGSGLTVAGSGSSGGSSWAFTWRR
ncbi:MAG TPA: hypothetical protein VEL07_11225 [Planctomycetota bacterium]|nr:hypothetical protein [Planctomycetota bacterium]